MGLRVGLLPIILTSQTKTLNIMKTVFTSILTLFTLPLLAQVTIEQSNYPATAGYNDSFSVGATIGVVAPSVGASQTWDYSGLVEASAVNSVHIDATSDPNFPDALNRNEANLSFQGFPIPSQTYTTVDANGYYEYGRAISDVTHSITAISGGANDVLNFPDDNHVFQFENGRVNYLGFPATFQSSWTGTRIEPINFNLTVAGFGLNNTPGQQVKYWTETREVVGYGSLTIPLPNGDPSGPMEVLLLESSVSVIDSFFLAGSEAPAPLLAAFGLTQGSIATSSSFLFYMPDFHSPLVRFGMDGSTVASIGYRPVAASAATGISSVQLDNVSMYPNPIAAGDVLNIDLSDRTDAATIELIDLTGRMVYSTPVNGNAATVRVALPTGLSAGIYNVILRDAQSNPMSISKLSIQ